MKLQRPTKGNVLQRRLRHARVEKHPEGDLDNWSWENEKITTGNEKMRAGSNNIQQLYVNLWDKKQKAGEENNCGKSRGRDQTEEYSDKIARIRQKTLQQQNVSGRGKALQK